jgi:hypothetical protein
MFKTTLEIGNSQLASSTEYQTIFVSRLAATSRRNCRWKRIFKHRISLRFRCMHSRFDPSSGIHRADPFSVTSCESCQDYETIFVPRLNIQNRRCFYRAFVARPSSIDDAAISRTNKRRQDGLPMRFSASSNISCTVRKQYTK